MRSYIRHQPSDISFGSVEIFGLAAAQLYSVISEQPRRKSAEIPFAAYVRTGADNNIQALLACRFYKALNVKHTLKAILALARLMQIPAAVGFNRIKARRFKL